VHLVHLSVHCPVCPSLCPSVPYGLVTRKQKRKT